jgi:galactosamine-6-phosphate isomerase
MLVTYSSDYKEMSGHAASLVLEEIQDKPDLLLCVATGSSPEGLYRELAATAGRKPDLFNRLRILKLDEWGGIPENHPASCEYYVNNEILKPLRIPRDRYISFASDPESLDLESGRIRSRILSEGPIDICILGLGKNGHLGLNEPAPMLKPYAHVTALTDTSLEHSMIASLEQKPTYGLTLGLQEILSSKKIIMLVAGKGKKQVAEKLMEGKISTHLPASFLWLHPHVECLVDSEVLR